MDNQKRKLTRAGSILGVLGLVPALAAFPTATNAAQANGTVVLNVAGTLRNALSGTSTTILTCSGTAFLAPNVSGTTTLSTLTVAPFLMSAGQSTSTKATIGATKATFTCTVTIPYIWDNASTTGQVMGIVVKVEGWDSIQGYLGNTRQILETIPVPKNGTTTTLSVSTTLL